MKKISAITLVTVILLVIFFSCVKSELEYSCDPTINMFVKENLEELSLLTTSELTLYNLKLQRAIFNSWDFNKKREIWIDKLQQVQINVTFSNAETIHIQRLIDHINEDYFLDEDIKTKSEIHSRYSEEWINYARNELCWTEQFIAFMVYRLYTFPSEFEAELSELKSIRSSVTTNSECDCSYSADFCGYANCFTGGCTTTMSGCGWLWSMPCDGFCR